MGRLFLPLITASLLVWGPASAQHQQHKKMLPPKTGQSNMASAFFLDLPMARDGSGTAWHPDNTPIFGHHAVLGKWNMMLHGTAHVRYTIQDIFNNGRRGGNKLDGPNWVMGMAHRPFGKRSQLMFRAMLTFEPVTEGGEGFPMLFQSGETYNGRALIDTQHPHDLFAELAVAYSHSFSRTAGLFLYFGLPGEPALGPPAFMHRPSARHLSSPPIAHHWQDVTHVTFGVVTVGLRHENLKFDASVFTGREPNQHRYTFDRPRFDSYSFRLTGNPSDKLSIQISRGFLNSPEEIAPEQDQWRTTASVLYNHPVKNGLWATALVWGSNETANFSEIQDPPGLAKSFLHSSVSGELHSVQLESDLQIGKQAYFTRMEWVEKSPSDLGVSDFILNDIALATFSLGTARRLMTSKHFNVMLGALGTFYYVPEQLRPVYGNKPLSLNLYLRLSPNIMQMNHHAVH